MSSKSSISVNQLIEEALVKNLSQVLPSVLSFAIRTRNKSLEKWVRLELQGYYSSNPAMEKSDIVPEYRTIGGYFVDEYNRPLIIQDSKLQFINEDRVRNGVVELEQLSQVNGPLSYLNPGTTEIIREHLNIEVTRFVFQPSALHAVLSSIRSELIVHLELIRDEEGDDDAEINKEKISERKSTINLRKIVFLSFLLVFTFSSATFLISYFIQPHLDVKVNYLLFLVVASFSGVVAFIAAINEVISFFLRIFEKKE